MDAAYGFKSRFETGMGTNPEELIAAAHASCYSMALSLYLTQAGHPPTSIQTSSAVTIEKDGDGFTIIESALTTRGEVPGLDEAGFRKHAEGARNNCPVSKALTGVKITLDATLGRLT
jgi:osmotically inducible protein OsmC